MAKPESTTELKAIGHTPMSAQKALRLHCIDCAGGSPHEVALCTARKCPAWPFRLGRNPWKKAPSEAQKLRGRQLASRRAGGENL